MKVLSLLQDKPTSMEAALCVCVHARNLEQSFNETSSEGCQAVDVSVFSTQPFPSTKCLSSGRQKDLFCHRWKSKCRGVILFRNVAGGKKG